MRLRKWTWRKERDRRTSSNEQEREERTDTQCIVAPQVAGVQTTNICHQLQIPIRNPSKHIVMKLRFPSIIWHVFGLRDKTSRPKKKFKIIVGWSLQRLNVHLFCSIGKGCPGTGLILSSCFVCKWCTPSKYMSTRNIKALMIDLGSKMWYAYVMLRDAALRMESKPDKPVTIYVDLQNGPRLVNM